MCTTIGQGATVGGGQVGGLPIAGFAPPTMQTSVVIQVGTVIVAEPVNLVVVLGWGEVLQMAPPFETGALAPPMTIP